MNTPTQAAEAATPAPDIVMASVLQKTLPYDDDEGNPVTAAHQARSGKVYTLSAIEPCLVPMEDAYTFLVDPAFEVRDDTGRIIKPPSTKKVEAGRVELDDDEVIANFDELTKQSLLKRCKALEGSEALTINSTKDAMIFFLVENKPKPQYGVARGSEGAPRDMSGIENLVDLSSQL